MNNNEEFAAWMGLDWADRAHAVSLRTADSDRVESLELAQQPEAIHQWMIELRLRFGGRPLALAVELSRGPLIYALMQYDFLVIFPINPKALSDYRKVFRPSGAKSDASDATLLLDLLCHYQGQLHPWRPEDPESRALRMLVEQRRKLVQERTRWLNRLTSRLKEYFPQMLGWFPDLAQASSRDFLLRWPSLQTVKRVQNRTLEGFFRKHRLRRDKALRILREIREGVPLTHDPAVLDVHPGFVQGLVRQLATLQDEISRLDHQIQTRLQQHPETRIFQSFPGAGARMTPRLVVAFGSDRERFDAYRMQCFGGIAPVTEASGQSCWIHHRFICSKFLKQTFHEFAQYSIPHSQWAKAFYQLQRARGKSHPQAVRSLAYKWIRILTRCWKDQTEYCEQTHLENLRRRNSPLIKLIEEAQAA